MAFPDASLPIATCAASGCDGCPVAGSVHCHFQRADLVHFVLVALPSFLVGGAGVLAVGVVPLVIWLGVTFGFFWLVEIRVMCSHCPHYAEEGATLRCWANYGIPKLWTYRPGPMSTAEKVTFLGGFGVVWGYPAPFFVVAGLWLLLGLYVLVTAAFFVTLKRSFCSQCMNFACPLNGVPDAVRVQFWERNPRVGKAWAGTRVASNGGPHAAG